MDLGVLRCAWDKAMLPFYPAATNMNAQSSRSHAVFKIVIEHSAVDVESRPPHHLTFDPQQR